MLSVTLFFTGQAGFILTAGNTQIGIDLYLSDCVERYDGFKRLSPKVVDPMTLKLDALIATHAHYDHFDPDSIPFLLNNKKARLYAAEDCKNEVVRLGLRDGQVTYVKAGDSMILKEMTLNFVFCDHGEAAPAAVGVLFEAYGKTIYMPGDTSLRLDKVNEIIQNRKIDILIPPINGAFGNMSEKDAVLLCDAIKPTLVIPCHYWMFAEQHGDPGLFIKTLKASNPEQKYLLMCPGESLHL